jgi:UDP-glucose 4-epimerase
MKILLTGASSMTGMWFAHALTKAGHEVHATFRQPKSHYDEPLRKARVQRAVAVCRPHWSVSFGDDAFLKLIQEEGPFDVLCHHGADVANYKSPTFDAVRAASANAYRVEEVFRTLRKTNCTRVVLTGSIFEPREGCGAGSELAISPYGLSKGLTAEIFRYYASHVGLSLGKFVIANPFGPFEEPRFTSYLMLCWAAGQAAEVRTPLYVRDNIHAEELAAIYARFVEQLPSSGYSQVHPSGYVGTQGDFTLRVAAETRQRIDAPCEVVLANQTEFAEPHMRVNSDRFDHASLDFDESRAWDNFVGYYKASFEQPAAAPTLA